MFSTTTMASSTTKPTAMVSAISDRLSRLKFSRYIAPAEPISASGTVTLGMSVAQKFRRNSRITSTTRAMVRTSVNCTSATEARIVVVRSSNGLHFDGRRNARGELRQLRLDLIDRVDDVGAGLLEHGEDDAVFVVLIGCDVAVLRHRISPARCR